MITKGMDIKIIFNGIKHLW